MLLILKIDNVIDTEDKIIKVGESLPYDRESIVDYYN